MAGGSRKSIGTLPPGTERDTGHDFAERAEPGSGGHGFQLVYAIVPQGKETLEEMAEWRKWEKN